MARREWPIWLVAFAAAVVITLGLAALMGRLLALLQKVVSMALGSLAWECRGAPLAPRHSYLRHFRLALDDATTTSHFIFAACPCRHSSSSASMILRVLSAICSQ